MSDYPEHEKMKAIKPDADIVAGFLEWLGTRQLVIAHWNDCEDQWQCTRKGIQEILADYFDIDLAKIDIEKETMLREFLERNGRI